MIIGGGSGVHCALSSCGGRRGYAMGEGSGEFLSDPDDSSMLYSILALLIARVSIPSFGTER